MTAAEYLGLRYAIINRGYRKEIEWSQSIQPPKTAEDFWCEYAWVVLNSGMKEQIARKIWEKVRPEVEAGKSASTVFGHKGKSAAIDEVWKNRDRYFREFNALTQTSAIIEYLHELPWIGDITKWHLAKNFGVDCAKPDRHLVRIFGSQDLAFASCARLSRETGDRIATVDLVIWRAANLALV